MSEGGGTDPVSPVEMMPLALSLNQKFPDVIVHPSNVRG